MQHCIPITSHSVSFIFTISVPTLLIVCALFSTFLSTIEHFDLIFQHIHRDFIFLYKFPWVKFSRNNGAKGYEHHLFCDISTVSRVYITGFHKLQADLQNLETKSESFNFISDSFVLSS